MIRSQPLPDYPFESHFVEVDGANMHYISEGDGDPVLFLHGQPTWSYLWRNIVPQVATEGRAIAVDLIGMGLSAKPDLDYDYSDHARHVDGFIEALELTNLVLVGHDWGSVLAFDFAMRHEDRVRGLAFMEALIPPAFPMASFDDVPEPARGAFRDFRDPVLGRELLIAKNVFIEEMLPAMTMRCLSDEELDAYRLPFLDPATREPLYRWPNELPISGEPVATAALLERTGSWLATTRLPKLHLHASPGATNPAEVAEWAGRHMSNIETVHVGPGIHFIQEDQSAAIGEALVDWLRRLP